MIQTSILTKRQILVSSPSLFVVPSSSTHVTQFVTDFCRDRKSVFVIFVFVPTFGVRGLIDSLMFCVCMCVESERAEKHKENRTNKI